MMAEDHDARRVRRSSSIEIVRPSSGATPSSGKNSAETSCVFSAQWRADAGQREEVVRQPQTLERPAVALPIEPVGGRDDVARRPPRCSPTSGKRS